MFSKTFVLTSLAVTASAIGLVPDAPYAMKRELQARQTDTAVTAGAGEACITALASIYSEFPTAPPELLSYEATVSITDACSFSIPKSLESAYSSYTDEFKSFYSAHEDEISSALSECPQYSEYATATDDISDACATTSMSGDDNTSAGTTGTMASTSATATDAAGSASSSAAAASSSVSPNAGPRETGFVAAAVAAAGFLGVVAAL